MSVRHARTDTDTDTDDAGDDAEFATVKHNHQTGFATPIVLAMLIVIALTAMAAIDAAGALVAATRARSAADASALAAAAGQWPFLGEGTDPEGAARTSAQVNGAQLESCDCAIRAERATVTVSVATSVRMLHIVPPRVHGTSTARVRPGVLFEGGP